MKSVLFQLAYQAASTVLLLFYAYKYQLGQKQHDDDNAVASKDSDRSRNAFGIENPPQNQF